MSSLLLLLFLCGFNQTEWTGWQDRADDDDDDDDITLVVIIVESAQSIMLPARLKQTERAQLSPAAVPSGWPTVAWPASVSMTERP